MNRATKSFAVPLGLIALIVAGHLEAASSFGPDHLLSWGANIGWISLGDSTFILQIESFGNGNDSDGDGIPDAWEIAHAGNLTSLSANGDFDHDGQSDLEEYLADTDPTDPFDNLRIVKLSLAL